MSRFDDIWEQNRDLQPKIESLAEIFEGRTLYTVSIPIEDRKVISHFASLQKALPKDALSMTAEDRFHISIKILGFLADEDGKETISAQTVEKVKEALPEVAHLLRKPVVIGPVNRFPNVVFMEVNRAEGIIKAHKRLHKLVKTDFGHEDSMFLPHITLARFITDSDKAVQAIVELREKPGIEFTPNVLQISTSRFEGGKKKKQIIGRYKI